ncbi:hypothetical protein H312_01841, partial [Anncaliia algerae PRA339]
MDFLDDIGYDDLVILLKNESSAIEFAQIVGLIPRERLCTCGASMYMRSRTSGKNKGFYFRCSERSCRKEVSIKKDTFFENSHLEISVILKIIYKFVVDEGNFENNKKNLKVKQDKTLVDWLEKCRNVCLDYFILNPTLIGGDGIIVEIDECHLVKRKYHR